MNWKNFFAAVAGGAIISGSAAAAVINEGDRILVAYYSLSGNTRAVAEQIKRETGADVAVIETAEAYPHGGSGLGHAEADIKTMLPAARVEKGHAFWGRNARNAGEEVKDWIKELKNE